MAREGMQRRLAAILSADAVGYSRLMAQDEVATVQTLTAYREQMEVLVRQHRGRVVDSPGDNLLAEFPSALDATSCGVDVQRVVAARNAALPEDLRMEFRIGIHLGDVLFEGERIYGDGVNIAARLEGLAPAGGICISGPVHGQLQRKLDVDYEDLGEQEVKNIPQPVHVFRLQFARGDRSVPTPVDTAKALMIPGFAGPAIAVLPFANMSGDPEQEYFADGITEDLITRLASGRGFPVIARNSTFVYKGRAVDVKQVSEELGARYLVEGSVRKAGNRVRITAQLIDCSTGKHIWAERYDRELSDVFELQDEITQAIGASAGAELFDFELKRVAQRDAASLDAWESTARGWWHWNELGREDNEKARGFFQQALELDPRNVSAYYGIAMSHYFDLLFQWTDDAAESVRQLVQMAEKTVRLDEKDPIGQFAVGWAYQLTGQRDKSIAAMTRAVELNPSFALAYFWLGVVLALAARPEEAHANFDKAMRLSPQDPQTWAFLYGRGLACFAARQYEQAVDWVEQSLQRRRDWVGGWRTLASSLAHLERLDEARSALQELRRLSPELSLATVRLGLLSAEPDFLERYLDGLRKAGIEG